MNKIGMDFGAAYVMLNKARWLIYTYALLAWKNFFSDRLYIPASRLGRARQRQRQRQRRATGFGRGGARGFAQESSFWNILAQLCADCMRYCSGVVVMVVTVLHVC